MKRIVILISGRGSNMQALLGAALPGRVVAVISNRPDAGGLALARDAGVVTAVVDHKAFPDRESFDLALAERVAGFEPDLVVLAGFMRVLTTAFIQRFADRLINIHPSLLPSFPGLHTHRRALEAGVRVHGCTVHFVRPEVDAGPIIIQAVVPVLPDDDESALAKRVLEQEHRIFPQAVAWFLEGRLAMGPGGRVKLSGCAPPGPALVAPALDRG